MKRYWHWVIGTRDRLSEYFCTTALIPGTLFFALSLTPSLLPRGEVMQGIVSGLSFSAGYALGLIVLAAWQGLHLPEPKKPIQWTVKAVAGSLCALAAILALWQADQWQNSLRSLMEMDPTSGMRSLIIAMITIAVFIVLYLLVIVFGHLFRFLTRHLESVISARAARLGGILISLAIFWALVDGLLFSLAIRSADTTHRQLDALIEAELDAPDSPQQAGGPGSLLDWADMGRQGRRFIANTPDSGDIESVTNQTAMKPIRVYAGLNTGDSVEERANMVLQELRRLGGFERSRMVLVTPTGTGWVDPAGMEPLEYMLNGDVASMTMQYSYLPSPISLMAEGAYGAESARALFQAIYGYWRSLPNDERPRLYLFGLSLGALNSDRSFDLYDIIDDPFSGALWSGPPFRSDTWRDATQRRQPDSPAWLPRFRDDSVIRFANQHGGLSEGRSEWGNFRIAFLQYASDPITFFSPDSFYREPDWFATPRGPDVSDDLRWFPVVTMLQLTADMLAGTSPTGYGHEIAARDYLYAWLALMEPEHLDNPARQALQAHFEEH